MRTILVFGSNTKGIHGAGSAKHAKEHYSAKWGVWDGLTGDAYGIPTKEHLGFSNGKHTFRVLSLLEIAPFVAKFREFAGANKDLNFDVVKVGCGLAGHKEESMRELFRNMPTNVNLPDGWVRGSFHFYDIVGRNKFQGFHYEGFKTFVEGGSKSILTNPLCSTRGLFIHHGKDSNWSDPHLAHTNENVKIEVTFTLPEDSIYVCKNQEEYYSLYEYEESVFVGREELKKLVDQGKRWFLLVNHKHDENESFILPYDGIVVSLKKV